MSTTGDSRELDSCIIHFASVNQQQKKYQKISNLSNIYTQTVAQLEYLGIFHQRVHKNTKTISFLLSPIHSLYSTMSLGTTHAQSSSLHPKNKKIKQMLESGVV